MLVVELEQRALAIADLEEAHHLAEVVATLVVHFPALDGSHDPLGHDRRLEVSGRAGLRQRQIGRVAQGVHVRPPADLQGGAIGRQPSAGCRRQARIDEELLALVRRHEDEQVVGELLALEALDDVALGIDGLDVEERVQLDALALQNRRGHVGHALDRERAPDRRAEVELGTFAQPALAQLGLDQKRDLQRGRWALVRHARDADHDPAAGERVERLAQLERRLGGVEVLRLGLEVLDRLGHDARAGGEHEVVVGEALAIGEVDEASLLVDLLHFPHHQGDARVEQSTLGPLEVLGALTAHGDVHEARLIGVLAGLVDDRDRHLAGLDLAPQLLE